MNFIWSDDEIKTTVPAVNCFLRDDVRCRTCAAAGVFAFITNVFLNLSRFEIVHRRSYF
jgi:hypothetical protein